MRSQSWAARWRTVSWTFVCLVSLGFVVSIVAGA